jgi:hypothetical protein
MRMIFMLTSTTGKTVCYYKGTVFLEFAINSLSDLKQRIITIENHLNKAVADRDFARFLKIVDPRLAPDLFMEVSALFRSG